MPNYIERNGELFRTIIGTNGSVRETRVTGSVHMDADDEYAYRQFQRNQQTGENNSLVPQHRKTPDWEAVRRAFS